MALVIFAIALVPIVRSFALLNELGTASGQQSRREAWRSTADQVVASGIDPSGTGVLQRLTDPQTTAGLMGAVQRRPVSSVDPFRSGVSLLLLEHSNSPEPRAVPAGFEIGRSAGATLPVREDPLPPLPPRKLSPPVIRSPGAPLVQISELRTVAPGQPFVADIVAAGTDLVRIRQSAPRSQENSGAGAASLTVDAVELAGTVRGEAWTEYASTSNLDTPVSLSGNRTRWLVLRGRQVEVVDPSDPVAFDFGLFLGRPILRLGAQRVASGGAVAVDFAIARAVERGMEASIGYPDDVMAAFGGQWPAVAPSFVWTFGAVPGDSSSGSLISLFREQGRRLWQAQQTLAALPVTLLSGVPQLAGTWTVERQTTPLQPPERSGAYYEGLTDAPGPVDFVAPVLESVGTRVGRPEVAGIQSTTETLTVPIVP